MESTSKLLKRTNNFVGKVKISTLSREIIVLGDVKVQDGFLKNALITLLRYLGHNPENKLPLHLLWGRVVGVLGLTP